MKLALLALCFFSTTAFGSVWKASSNKRWNKRWQKKYSSWVARKVGPTFFKDLGGPFADLKIDCADAHYGLKAYFSRAHGLPFAAGRGRTTHKTSRFDHLGNPDKKLAAFIAMLAGSYGTESLAHSDTYPVGLRKIKPGDLFMYKVGTNANPTRHTYIIKNINLDGTFDVIYSTQQRAAEGRSLGRHKSYIFKKAPLNTGVDKNHWGFRRYKLSHEMGVSQEDLSASDFSQYRTARSLVRKYGKQKGRLEFFRTLKKKKQTVSESPKKRIERNFTNLCSGVKDRVKAVKSGLRFAQKIGGRCMNFQEYDSNSTPSRDSGLKDDVRNYLHDYSQISKKRKLKRVGADLQKVSEALFAQRPSSSAKRKIFSLCPVKTGTKAGALNLASFKTSLMANKVSFHPNDNAYRRWGVSKGRATRCKTYYGYPN